MLCWMTIKNKKIHVSITQAPDKSERLSVPNVIIMVQKSCMIFFLALNSLAYKMQATFYLKVSRAVCLVINFCYVINYKYMLIYIIKYLRRTLTMCTVLIASYSQEHWIVFVSTFLLHFCFCPRLNLNCYCPYPRTEQLNRICYFS